MPRLVGCPTIRTRRPIRSGAAGAADSSSPAGRAVVALERDGEAEGRSAARRTGHADLAAHHANQLLADGQPQPGSAVAAVGLSLPCSNMWNRRERTSSDMPMPVSRTVKRRITRAVTSRDRGRRASTSPSFGELDGVAGRVEDHLTQPSGVSTRSGTSSAMLRGPPAVSGVRAARQFGHAGDQGGQGERFDLQGPSSGLDLGEVEDVVDDRPEAPVPNDAPPRRSASGARPGACRRSSSLIPRMPFMGGADRG